MAHISVLGCNKIAEAIMIASNNQWNIIGLISECPQTGHQSDTQAAIEHARRLEQCKESTNPDLLRVLAKGSSILSLAEVSDRQEACNILQSKAMHNAHHR